MKKTVEFQIDSDTRVRITRYSGTGRVNVNASSNGYTYRIACTVGDLSEEVQAHLERYGMGCTRNRRRKHTKPGEVFGR